MSGPLAGLFESLYADCKAEVIVDSIERLVQRNVFSPSSIFG